MPPPVPRPILRAESKAERCHFCTALPGEGETTPLFNAERNKHANKPLREGHRFYTRNKLIFKEKQKAGERSGGEGADAPPWHALMARLPRTLRFRCGFAAAGAVPGPEQHRGRGAAAVRTGAWPRGDVMGRVGGVSRRRCRAGRARDGAGGAAGPAGPAAGWLPAAPGLAPTPVRAGAAPLGSGRLGTCGVPAGTGAARFF